MAQFGAKYPNFAPFAGAEPVDALPKYGARAVIGRLVAANLTVNLATGELWADDDLAETHSEFASGTLAMETDDMEDATAAVVYGASATEKRVTYKKGDVAPYVGLAYYKVLKRKGVVFYKGYFYPKAVAALGNDNAQTRGNSITFGTTATNFTIMAPNTGEWRITETFTTEAEAKAWVDEQLAAIAQTNQQSAPQAEAAPMAARKAEK